MSDPGELGMWLAIGAGQVAFWAAITPLIKAGADRIAGRGANAKELASLHDRLTAIEERGVTTGEVELADARLAELEERLDFAERLLAQRAESANVLREGEPA